VISRAVGEVSPSEAAQLEQRAVSAALSEQLDPDRLRLYAREAQAELDAQAFLDNHNRAFERRRLHLSQEQSGMFALSGRLDVESGCYLTAALEPFMAPHGQDDPRTPAQRRADALRELCRRQLSQSPSQGQAQGQSQALPQVAGRRPQLSVTATIAALSGEPGVPAGKLSDLFAIPAQSLRRLACDCSLEPMIVDGKGIPISVGHTRRRFPAAIRRALIRRDQHCRFPGCTRPASWCEPHHLIHWCDGGSSDIGNGVLLCDFHHHLVHEGGWQVKLQADGSVIAIPPPRSRAGPGAWEAVLKPPLEPLGRPAAAAAPAELSPPAGVAEADAELGPCPRAAQPCLAELPNRRRALKRVGVVRLGAEQPVDVLVERPFILCRGRASEPRAS
jgi:hypothetical protein